MLVCNCVDVVGFSIWHRPWTCSDWQRGIPVGRRWGDSGRGGRCSVLLGSWSRAPDSRVVSLRRCKVECRNPVTKIPSIQTCGQTTVPGHFVKQASIRHQLGTVSTHLADFWPGEPYFGPEGFVHSIFVPCPGCIEARSRFVYFHCRRTYVCPL